MTDQLSRAARVYLRELDAALAGVPQALRRDILDGIASDLAGLDPAAAAERIEQLGDPNEIAADVSGGVPAASGGEPGASATALAAPPAQVAPPAPPVSPRWYVVVTSLVVAFGGFVIPVIGWIAGITMMWMSRSWARWEKWTATLLPFAVLAVTFAASAIAGAVERAGAPTPGVSDSPLVVSAFSGWHAAILLMFVIPPVTGIWLLVRGLRRP
ncbi:hypothetical protein ET445_00665 [Agromyces protaetiae]|uniref:Uncharacterized protein n=1 Tax=Agromyces protaetiae TaxID=2509455 RepID=A0A4P6F8B0_9MICO|nr:hypothetical protein [Agromyces protaetiae]QAY72062.1 hypothetical protein ET445_00665 [Agromyces protaetiae]